MIGPLRKLVLTEDGRTKPVGAIAVVLVLVASCSALGYYFWKGGVDLGGGMPQIKHAIVCWNCGYTRFERLQPGSGTLGPCPKCKKDTLGLGYPCPQCGTPVVLNEARGLKPPTKCPKCGREFRHGD
ncbi:MAG: hypothetical protein ACPMAQ_06605 [Phycisphaerae bacterium]